jgi:outer membrane protein TolC
VASVCVLAGAESASAGEHLPLSRALSLALENNPGLQQVEAQRLVAAQRKREAQSHLLPSVELRETALRTDSPADAFGLQLMQERFSFPEFAASDPNTPEPLNNFATEVSATWPIFTGGRVLTGIAQADRMAKAAEATSEHAREATKLRAATAYMNALLADRGVELARKARDAVARHVGDAQAFFDAGMLVESDLLQAKVHLARTEERVLEAENARLLARAALCLAMGVDQTREFDLDPPGAIPTVAIGDLPQAIAAARQSRGDVRAVAEGVEAARLGVRRARGEYLPEIALVGTYSLNDEEIFGSSGDSYMLMAMARWNVWNWGQTRAKVSASRYEHEAASRGQRAHLEAVEMEVRQAWHGVTEARSRLAVAQTAVQQAERAVGILEERFDKGITRVTDLLDAETMLDDARMRELTAEFDLQRAVRTLDFSVGGSHVSEVSP